MSLKAIKQETDRLQSLASNSEISAWVSANAGTGKTYVLVQRVLRLLLNGTQPEKILCLTFTKAAASEMANRLFDRLSEWATESDQELQERLHKLLGAVPNAEQIRDARCLFARALETPGGLKVQTIHAFCERLLKRFPLEAGISPHFAILDTDQERELLRSATDDILRKALHSGDHDLSYSLRHVIAYAGEDRFDTLLRHIIDKRDHLIKSVDQAKSQATDSLYKAVQADLCQTFHINPDLLTQNLEDEATQLLSDDDLENCIVELDGGKKTDQEIANQLRAVRDAGSVTEKYYAYYSAFLTTTGTPRSDKRFITKQIREDRPDLTSLLVNARDDFYDFSVQIEAKKVIEASACLITLADAVLGQYIHAKNSRSALDFDDLILKCSNLLGRSDAAAWVLYKLDGGIDHILVDEAQDTSPLAWTIVDYIANEFFAGHGASEDIRTVFAVGDEKQSIYGFQGAEPKKFAEMGTRFETKAKTASLAWERIPLTLSFRSTSPVLNAVDYVFSEADANKGLTAEKQDIKHFPFRQGQAGLVEVWDTEVPEEEEVSDPWDINADEQAGSPIMLLANRIADKIKYWLDTNEVLETRGTPIKPGDIIILVRKRNPFVTPMIRALKARGIPVAGADRIKITEQLAVMDLIALGDFLLMPEDDLSFATILKSPLFDFDDEDLFVIGHDRRASLWEALTKKADLDPRYEEAVVTIKQWLARADLVPPYEFFAGILLSQERRARIISRLGPEAGDAIDEFLNMAIQYDDANPPSIQGFLTWIRKADAEIKRDLEQGRNEVRIMTVHGAKGLEAEIVFMPDTCSNRGAPDTQSILEIEADDETKLVWSLPGTKQQAVINDTKDDAKLSDLEEYNRLLYVAMTRARDRLYVAGFEGKRGRDKGCWYDLVFDGLEPHMSELKDHKGETIWQLAQSQDALPDRKDEGIVNQNEVVEPPDWAMRRAPTEPSRSIPISPSSIVPLNVEEHHEIDLGDQTAISPQKLMTDNRFLRGQLTHALLEHLPEMDESLWEQAAHRLVEARGSGASPALRQSIVQETLHVLKHPEFAPIFSPQSQAEVSIVAKIPETETNGTPLIISGQIDRLVILEDQVLIIDYKTNRPPPHDPDQVAETYLAQLIAYRKAILDIIPDKSIRCALLWTDGPNLMEIPSQILDQKEAELVSIGWRRT